jgi:hypothetical protein
MEVRVADMSSKMAAAVLNLQKIRQLFEMRGEEKLIFYMVKSHTKKERRSYIGWGESMREKLFVHPKKMSQLACITEQRQ